MLPSFVVDPPAVGFEPEPELDPVELVFLLVVNDDADSVGTAGVIVARSAKSTELVSCTQLDDLGRSAVYGMDVMTPSDSAG